VSNKSGTSAQAITLPTGGGALHGIGETFSPDLFTGTGNLTVPIAVPPGRNGFQPQLSLTYSTGDGNGPFGLGWDLLVPSVSRKTSKGVPRFRDAATDPQEWDTFVLSGTEDLVAVSQPEPGVTRFRPRTEGVFARIDRLHGDGDVWRVSTRDGLVSTYGGGQQATVVADPANRSKVFCWKLTETTDPFGNRIDYQHLRDTGTHGPRTWDQLYLQRVRYVDFDSDSGTRFLVSVSFVYEERPDPFSEHRAGFEIRTRLRCRRIEVRTHAEPELLTRTYELDYLDDLVRRDERPESDLPLNGVSLLSRIRVVGHDGDRTEELPALAFGYSRFSPERQQFRPVEADGEALPPVSLADGDFETVDLFGNGLPDIVQMNGAVRFWRNRGSGRFDRPREMSEVPAGVQLRDPGVQLADMNGDGRADLLTLARGGYFPLAFGGRWSPEGFVQYPSSPNVAFGADDIRLVDLDGDGVIDALRTGPSFELFFNDPRRGWERVETRPRRPLSEFPNVTFSDPRVKLADLNGDGLQDIVLIGQGRLEYWPYLGHGNWGRRVSMESSPVFRDEPLLPEGFDPRRVLLGDLDGDGLADIVYVQADRLTLWINQGGEGWSAPVTVDSTPPFTDVDGIRLTDLLGNGMDGALWTADQIPGAGSHYQFLDLTGGLKPYLLERIDNCIGAVTTLRYAPSTRFCMADDGDAGTRWKTPLPFPVHVIERMQVVDEISGGTLTSKFRYHDGYWDGVERDFSGFGMVEQLDTESFADFNAEAAVGKFTPVAEEQFSPPLLTRSWFHQGPVGEESDGFVEPNRAVEYWPDDPPMLNHRESINAFLASLARSVRREALRALRGRVLRTELYARDGSGLEARPFTVTEYAYGLREESPPPSGGGARQRVFFPHLEAERTTQWERGTDPMTTLGFTDRYDAFGQPGREIRLAVPRGRDFRRPAPSAEPYLGTMTTTTFAVRDDDRYIVDRVASVTTHEIANDGQATVFDLCDAVRAGAADVKVIGQSLTYYDGEPFKALALGQVGAFGALVRSERLVLTDEILREAYRGNVGDPEAPPYLMPDGPRWTDDYPEEFRRLTPELAGFTFSSGEEGRARGYFAQQSRRRYDTQDGTGGRGLVIAERDELGRDTTLAYDRFGLLLVGSTDPVGLTARAEYDYRVLQPRLRIDINGNRTAFAYTPLGLLERTAVMGKLGEAVGDTLAKPSTTLDYDFVAASQSGARGPISVRTIRRAHHVNDGDVPSSSAGTMETVEYSDGFGRLIQTRARADDVLYGDPLHGDGTLPRGQGDPATQRDVEGRRNDDPVDPNVVVSGWQVYDNKGRVVERYEPFFASGWQFGQPGEVQLGQRLSMFHDPLGRTVRTIGSNGSEERVVHGVPNGLGDPEAFAPTPWESYTYDQNDNAGRTHGEDARSYADHWDTPTSTRADALGRPIVTTERTRSPSGGSGNATAPIRELSSVSTYDIRGNVTSRTDPRGRQVCRCLYDLADKLLRIDDVDAGLQRTMEDACGRELERRDSKGALVLRAHDLLGRPSRLWARDNKSSAVTLRARLEYGDRGDPAQSADERATARAGNRLGELERDYDEAGLVSVEQYDFKGNVAEKVRQVFADDSLVAGPIDWDPPSGSTLEVHADQLLDRREYRTSSRYDALNRVAVQRLPAGTDGARREERVDYDRAGALTRVVVDQQVVVERIAHDAKGQRTLVVLGNGVMARYAYDPQTFGLVRLRAEHYEHQDGSLTYQPRGGALQDLAYEYDLAGNLTMIIDGTLGSGVAGNAEAGSIDNPDLRALVVRGDALVRRFAYDPLYRLTSASGRECADKQARPPWSDGPRCGFNRGNQGVPNQDNAPKLTTLYRQRYTYDDVGSLTRVTHRGTTTTIRRFTVATDRNRIESVTIGGTVVGYQHDDSGNLVAESSSRHFGWDHSNRLKVFEVRVGSSEPSVRAEYLYDAEGKRVKKIVRKPSGVIESIVYVEGAFEHHRARVSGAPVHEHTTVHAIDGEQRVLLTREGDPDPDDHGPAMQYLLGDHLGSTSVVVDDHGAFVNREEFTPYGDTIFGGFARKRYRFNGKERDEESGLGFHGARYYASWLGRWISTDPAHAEQPRIQTTACSNLYTGFALNPLRHVDPAGQEPQEPVKLPGRLKRFAQKALLVLRINGPDMVADSAHWGPAPDQFAELSKKVDIELKSSRERKPRSDLPGPPDPPTDDWPTEGGGGARRPPVGRGSGSSFASRGSRLRRIVGVAGKGARLAIRTVGFAAVAIPVIHRSFMVGTYIRQREWSQAAKQIPLLVKDLNPLSILYQKPDKMSVPALGADQSIFQDRVGLPGSQTVSGCQNCHDAVFVDNWFKSTAEGQAWQRLNGEAAQNGFPTDAAVRFFEERTGSSLSRRR
jgi:RHS repeat-associated protein